MHVSHIREETMAYGHSWTVADTKDRSPKEMLDWLFPREYRRRDGGLNTAALAAAMKRVLGSRAPSQSTLHRMYTGVTKQADDATVRALSDFQDVPSALIRGEEYFSRAEMWGMDITAAEARVMRAMQLLDPEQRRVVYEQIRAFLPPDKRHLVPRLPEVTVLRIVPKKPTE